MRTLDSALAELSAAVPVGAESLAALAQKLRQPPPGTIDAAELHAALAEDDLPRLALLLSILAATDFRHQGELLQRLLGWLLRQEAALDAYDRGRFQHIRGFAAWRLQEDLLTAFTSLNRSIELLSALGRPAAHSYLGRVWNSYGQIMHHQGRFEAARQDFEVALGYRADNPADKAFTLGNLARVCIDFGDYQAAANYLAEDLAISRDLQGVPPGVEVQLLSELAHAELLLGRIDEAAEHYQRSAQLADERANFAGQIFAELGLGRVALARQPADLMAADACCRRLAGRIDSADLPQGLETELRALTDELVGDLAATRGDWATAQAAYVKTRDHRLSSPTTVPSELARILERLAQTQFALGQEMAAAMTLRTALGQLDATALDAQRKTIEDLLKQRFPQIWVLHAAGRFIGQAQIDYYLSHAGQSGFLGERRTMAVLFSDIRGFTSLSESLAPETLLPLLNDFLTRMTRCIEQAGGMVDKFIGDAVMAIFPDEAGANPCEQAVHAALLMEAELAHMNQHLQQPLAIGIGLHYGPMISGLIGSPQKRSYTVIGDTVNSGSRLEGMTKLLGARILVSAELAAGLSPGRFQLRPLGRFSPKGRQESLRVMELMGLQADGLAAQERARAIQGCETYMARLGAGDVPGALAQLETLANEEPDHSRAEGYGNIAGLLRQQAAERDPSLGVVLDFK